MTEQQQKSAPPTRAAQTPMGVGQWPAPAAMWSSATLGRPPKSAMEMWVSLFPFAPLFGVRWIWFGFAPLSGDAASFGEMRSGTKALSQAARAALESEKLGMTSMSAPALKPAAPAPAAAQATASWSATATARTPAQQTIADPQRPTSAPASDPQTAPSEASARSPQAAGLLRPPAPATPAAPETTSPEAAEPSGAPSLRPVLSAMPKPQVSDDVAEPADLFAARPPRVDDLKKIDGVGPRLEQLLNEIGVYQFEQIAAFTPVELRWLDERLFVIKGRAERDGWVEAAKRAIAERDRS